MIHKILLICFPLVTMLVTAQTQDHFIGTWENEDSTVAIQIYLEEDMYNGKMVSVDGNQSHSLIDKKTLIQMKRKRNILFGGTFSENGSSQEFEARIRLVNEKMIVIKLYSGIFGRRSIWRKVA